MSKRLLISDGSLAKQANGFQIAQTGVVKPVLKGLIAENGVARQFWPSSSGSSDPNIKWTTQPITSNAFRDLSVQPAIAQINFAVDGTYNYVSDVDANNPGTGNGTWLDVAVTGTGQYLIKADLVSGSGTVGDTLGVWLDAFTARSYGAQMATQGSNSVVMNISVANGSVTPQPGTEIIKKVTFNATISNAASKVVWTQTQWDLEEHTTIADADCDLNFFPNGTATGLADTSGNFAENWHADASSVPDPINFTVQVDLISGTAPTGDSLGVPLTLDANRTWKLPATSGEDFSNELDVTVSDGSVSIVKRVTMHSVRTVTPPANVWTTVQWNLDFNGLIQVTLDPDGTGSGSGTIPQNENWHSQAPAATDPQNYEAMMVPVSGDPPEAGSAAVNVWLNLSIQRVWTISTPNVGVWNLSIRRINEPEITKRIRLNTELK